MEQGWALHQPVQGDRLTEPLGLKEAFFLQEFTVVVKVWSTGLGRDAKEKVLFNFAFGSTVRSVRKGDAREIYSDVLEKLMAKYPAWAAGLPDANLHPQSQTPR